MKTIFREYDIRGIFEKDLNEKSVKLIGYFFGKRVKGKKIVAVGYDARLHSPILRDYLISGLNYAGCKVLDMGMVATPVNYFANYIEYNKMTTDASIMITGSHNPSEYNGFKITLERLPFFGKDIYSLGDEVIANQDIEIPNNTDAIFADIKKEYIRYMVENFSHLKGMKTKIVIDCGNGVAGTVIPDIFNSLDLDYKALYMQPDGTFPNHHPDPSVEENLKDIKKALVEYNANIGFAYDGDADRIAVLTPKHNIKGDQMALLYSMKMENPIVIGEVKCSQIMYDELEKRGAKAIMYKTGHSNLKVKMRETNADLACEVSGHIFFKNRYFGYDDAIYATLRMLELINDGIDLDKEIDLLPKLFSTDEIKVKTTDKEKFEIISKIKELLKNPSESFPKIKDIIEIDGVRINFENGWGLVRASNTTPILVTRFEATSEELLNKYQNAVNDLIVEVKNQIEKEANI